MDIVVRFIDQNGYIKERSLDLVHVKDMSALTLKNEILSSLSNLKLDVQDIRDQGYNGASNMRGEWNWLKALILNKCPFANYVHCFAHKLQLALVAASKDVSEVHTFFKHLNFIVNVIGSFTKRNNQLQDDQLDKISHIAETRDLEGGRGSNQLQSMQKTLIQNLKDDGWQSLLDQVVCFYGKHNIPIPHMNPNYRDVIQYRQKKDDVTVEHHYQVDVFIVAIDS
ncbi:zinc finger MYM-type protein 1-like protein [Tanacetum coccineum]